MGLDMYLSKIKRDIIGYKDVDLYEIKTSKPKLYAKLKPYIIMEGGSNYSYESLSKEVMYWRKANQIHNWFVNNVQDGNDDCGWYEVSKEQLEELRDTCKEVLEKSVLVNAPVVNGYVGTKEGFKPSFEYGQKVTNKKICEELLPTVEGFFFGGTDYDNYYVEDVRYTYEGLEKVLSETDFDTEAIFYSSSW